MRARQSHGDTGSLEGGYRLLFESAQVSLWEQDFSAVKSAVGELLASGVHDVRRYVAEHPEFVTRTIDLVRIVDVNDATVRMFRASDKAELLGSLHKVFVPASVVVFAEELVAIAEGRPFVEAEVAMRTVQGDPVEVLFTISFPPSDPQLRRVLVTLVDITARKAAESALREEARTLEALNRVGRTLSAENDLQRIVQAVTDAATEVTGAKFGAFFYNVEDASGESYMLYTLSGAPPEAFAKFGMPRRTPMFGPTFEGQGPVRIDDVLVDPRYGRNPPHHGMPKGHLPVRSYLAVPVMPRAGEVIGGLFFGHPEPGVFTERHERLVIGIASQAAVAIENARLQEQRLQLIERLRETDQRKDEFLATLSHELRNPLAPLRSGLHLLRLEGKPGGSSGQILEVMERQVNHLVRLVDDLLEMSRISRGKFELRKELVELAAIVNNALETSESSFAAAEHAVDISLPQTPVWIEGDPVRLAQILANLLDNAAKYTEHGGRISVQGGRDGDAAVISVRDTGCGISPEALPRVFEMFSRGDHSSGRSPSGLGIGLALARKLAQMHGGSVTAHSEGVDRGSEFVVRLPLARDQSGSAVARPASEASLPSRRILVVDDNRDAAESLGMLLEALGADVRVAIDGPGALKMLESFDAAMILLDIGMPGMDGYEVARRIRSDFPGRRPTIVALTGWGQEEDRRRARAAGFDQHLVKPAELDALEALLASLT
jgi:signal transduction histidine kinase/PAS domain-containing protein